MSPNTRLVIASVTFTVLYMAFYIPFSIWLAGGYDARRLIIWTLSGLLAGVIWYFGMRIWMRRSGRLNGS